MPDAVEEMTELYKRRYGASDAPPRTPALDVLNQAKDELRNAPPGDAQAQKDMEATYKAIDGEEPTAPEPVAVDWHDGPNDEVSESDRVVRQEIQASFGEFGLSSEAATQIIGIARKLAFSEIRPGELEAKAVATERTLRRLWGKSYDANVQAAYAMADNFGDRFDHPDLTRAQERGLWLEVDVVRALADAANRRGVPKLDVVKLRQELMQVNEGSPRHREITQSLESYYRKIHGM